jgi:uncharacterized protein YegP (UPF0339 family)
MYFEIVKTKGESQWHARIRGDNNRIVFWTQDYDTKAAARHACEIVQAEAASAAIPDKSLKEGAGSPI